VASLPRRKAKRRFLGNQSCGVGWRLVMIQDKHLFSLSAERPGRGDDFFGKTLRRAVLSRVRAWVHGRHSALTQPLPKERRSSSGSPSPHITISHLGGSTMKRLSCSWRLPFSQFRSAPSPTPRILQLPSHPRERLLMDFGWNSISAMIGHCQGLTKAARVMSASMDYSDASWRQVQLPTTGHRTPFDAKADGSHGFKALARLSAEQRQLYRRTFNLAKEDGNRRFGWNSMVFRDCTVFVNGWFIGHHQSGYTSFRYDITDVANFGEKNLVAVRVDATQTEGWFYEGAASIAMSGW